MRRRSGGLARGLSVFVAIIGAALPVCAADLSVVDVSGQAQWRESSDKPWKDLQKSQPVATGADLVTGADAKVDLAFPGKQPSVLRVGPDSLAQVIGVEPPNIRINQGKIFALVRGLKKGSTFRVSSPTAIASARGTGWTQTPERVEVFEETVGLVGSGGKTLEVAEGFGVDIGPDGDFGDVVVLDEEARERFDEFRREAARRADEPKDDEDLPGFDPFDSHEEWMDAKEEFEAVRDQEALDEALRGDDNGNGDGDATNGSGGPRFE